MSGYLHFYAQHPAIALIAEKLNESGNAFHNTADWQDETDYLGGKSACDIVQEALNAADEAFNTLAARVRELEVDAERYRYLRTRNKDDVFDNDGERAGVWIDCTSEDGTLQLLTLDDADSAIDAARSAP